jgi:autonomous glycyl radical cofactor GrcA
MIETTESIKVNLANGVFYSGDAASIIRGMIEVKVKFHEDKISRLSNMEEIEMREQRIKELQRMQSKIQEWLKAHGEQANLELTLSVG